MNQILEEFEFELEMFRKESDSAIQFFYSWQTVYAVAAKNKSVLRLLNQAPLFWNTSLGGLQSSAFVTLGRIFDPNTQNHSVSKVLTIAHSNLELFSKVSLANRKRKASKDADEWLPKYLESVHEPTSKDIRNLKKHVAKRRRIYEENYKPLRHQIFAHRGRMTKAEVDKLFAETNNSEMQKMLIFLSRLHESLWQMYFNGRKPTLRPARFSVNRILDKPSLNPKQGNMNERLIDEIQKFLEAQSKLI
jgi:hypothetical protein